MKVLWLRGQNLSSQMLDGGFALRQLAYPKYFLFYLLYRKFQIFYAVLLHVRSFFFEIYMRESRRGNAATCKFNGFQVKYVFTACLSRRSLGT